MAKSNKITYLGTGRRKSSVARVRLVEGTGKITIYKNTSIFDELMERYKNTGEDIYFDIQVSNSDPTSAAGVCTMVFSGCNVDGGVLASFDVDGDFLEQEIDFTFEDFSNPTKFTQLAGMQ